MTPTPPLLAIAILLGTFISAPARAAEITSTSPAPHPATPIRFLVERVEDSRATDRNNACRVTLSYVEGDLGPLTATTARLKVAVDELDRDLLLPSPAPRLVVSPTSVPPDSRARLTLTLKNPSRAATVIKRIEGTADVFRPTEENGGLATITTDGRVGSPLAHSVLEKNGIELRLITPEEAAKLRVGARPGSVPITFSSIPAPPNAEIEQQRLESIREEVARRRQERESVLNGAADIQPPAAVAAEVARRRAQRESTPEQGITKSDQQRLDNVTAEVARRRQLRDATVEGATTLPQVERSGFAGRTEVPDTPPVRIGTTGGTIQRPARPLQLNFQVTDPGNKLVGLDVRTRDGVPVRSHNMQYRGLNAVTVLGDPGPEFQLVVYIASEAAITSHPFVVENISLP